MTVTDARLAELYHRLALAESLSESAKEICRIMALAENIPGGDVIVSLCEQKLRKLSPRKLPPRQSRKPLDIPAGVSTPQIKMVLVGPYRDEFGNTCRTIYADDTVEIRTR